MILSNDAFMTSKTNQVILVHIIRWIPLVSESGVEMVVDMQMAVLAKIAKEFQPQALWVSVLEKHL